ncbi:MAG: pantoate--beta-alanine ligase [Planctomycetes bacterium]|nr:pantoate--beta-alanine ligase [Planctomycetota bacterium]
MSKIKSPTIRVETSAAKTCEAVRAAQQAGKTVGFVPTMGALHEGHLSLVDASLAECDKTIVSIFVNPTQFGPDEDLKNYPRSLDRDLELLEQRGCWLVFAPPVEEVYREGHETSVDVGSVALPWEGKSRPDHFGGVATVVLKLFQIVPADRAYFGQKDYQQSLVIRQMAADLNVPIEIRVCPIVREPDGLAKSSRNAYLSPEERKQASGLWQALKIAETLVAEGETSAAVITEKMKPLLEHVDVESRCFERVRSTKWRRSQKRRS